METLLVVDAQNEFSAGGLRQVPNHASALRQIERRVEQARRDKRPIAWVRHHNKPHEWPGFEPGSWGAELSPNLGPRPGFGPERLFEKDVFGAFTGTGLEPWLREVETTHLLIVGFYAHMCLSTSTREALIRGFEVAIDPEATGSRDIDDPALGFLNADEVRRSALLHLVTMGATIASPIPAGADSLAGVADSA
jgi:nicotinamidase-related amidase